MIVPAPIEIGPGVRTRKCSQGGVSTSRLWASLKKANTSAIGRASHCSVVRVLTRTFCLRRENDPRIENEPQAGPQVNHFLREPRRRMCSHAGMSTETIEIDGS